MLDGKIYTSKSKLRETYRRAGVTEVGNDPSIYRRQEKPRPDRQEIRTAIRRAASKMGL